MIENGKNQAGVLSKSMPCGSYVDSDLVNLFNLQTSAQGSLPENNNNKHTNPTAIL